MLVQQISTSATIQDGGRVGYRGLGVGTSGAMDTFALHAGNIWLGNDANAPALEIVLGGVALLFDKPAVICLTGAVLSAHKTSKDGTVTPVYHHWRTPIQAGDSLVLGQAVQGMYAYLCIAGGGFTVPKVLGSASTNSKAGFGGYDGRALQVGDSLPYCASSQGQLQAFSAFVEELPMIGEGKTALTPIRVLPSSEYDLFDQDSIDALSSPWQVSSSSNRMGYRLMGTPLTQTGATQLLSHGVDKGMIQVPPEGQPIVLLADAQTTGGYPKIASVIQADLGRLAQVRLGRYCQFVWVDKATAVQAYARRARFLARLTAYVDLDLGEK